jgi:LEA14-like dessication related protein
MRILALALTMLVAACATAISKPPVVTLAGVDLESIGLFEQRYVLQLRVMNPNDADIPIEGLTFDVELNGMRFASGVSNSAVTVPRLGEALLEVRATSNLASVMRQLHDLQKGGRGSLDYRIKGSLRVSGYGALPFEKGGELSFPDLVDFGEKRAPGPAAPQNLPGSI